MGNKFTRYILIAMALGIVVGTLIYEYLPEDRAEISSSINLIAMLFLRLIKMIIAPLVFATLVGGIAHMGSGSKLGRIFAKTMGWFVTASFVSLMLSDTVVHSSVPTGRRFTRYFILFVGSAFSTSHSTFTTLCSVPVVAVTFLM